MLSIVPTDGHQASSPTPIFSAVKQLAKGMEAIAHQNTLLIEESHDSEGEGSKRRRAKKARVCQEGVLTE